MFFRNSFWHIIVLVKPVYLMSQREPFSKNLRYFAWIFIIIIIASHPSEHQESCILVTVKGIRLNYTSLLPSNRLWNRIAWFTFFCILEIRWRLFQVHKHSPCQISTDPLPVHYGGYERTFRKGTRCPCLHTGVSSWGLWSLPAEAFSSPTWRTWWDYLVALQQSEGAQWQFPILPRLQHASL